MSRLTFRQPFGVDPPRLWDLFLNRSIASLWVFPTKPTVKFSEVNSRNALSVHEVLRIGPISFEVTGDFVEQVPFERSFLFLDGSGGIRITEEIRLERIASGTELSLTVDFSFGFGVFGDWLDRIWITRWVSRRIQRALSDLQQEYPLHGGESSPDMDDAVSFVRPGIQPDEISQKGGFKVVPSSPRDLNSDLDS